MVHTWLLLPVTATSESTGSSKQEQWQREVVLLLLLILLCLPSPPPPPSPFHPPPLALIAVTNCTYSNALCPALCCDQCWTSWYCLACGQSPKSLQAVTGQGPRGQQYWGCPNCKPSFEHAPKHSLARAQAWTGTRAHVPTCAHSRASTSAHARTSARMYAGECASECAPSCACALAQACVDARKCARMCTHPSWLVCTRVHVHACTCR